MKKKGHVKRMPKKRVIPPVDTKYYASEGVMKAEPDTKHQAVKFSMHYCSAFLSPQETMTIALQLIHAGASLWGEHFITDTERYLETMRGS